jgi:hypothetical protein
VTDTPHTSPDKKKLKEKAKSSMSQAMDKLKKGSPSKIPALFRMPGWLKPKVLTEEEKADVFAGQGEKRREMAEAHAKQDRLDKAAKEAKRKEQQNERQRRSRALKRAASDTENPGGKKRRKVRITSIN